MTADCGWAEVSSVHPGHQVSMTLLARATLATCPRGLLTVYTGAGGNCTALVGGARCAACEKVAVAAPTAGRE